MSLSKKCKPSCTLGIFFDFARFLLDVVLMSILVFKIIDFGCQNPFKIPPFDADSGRSKIVAIFQGR